MSKNLEQVITRNALSCMNQLIKRLDPLFLSSSGLESIIQVVIELEQTFTSQDPHEFPGGKMSLNYQDWVGKFSHLPLKFITIRLGAYVRSFQTWLHSTHPEDL